jgi:single-strand DNA-binding protein
MAAFNKVILAGNITRDPELRVTPYGTPICQFGLAINRQFKTESGEKREEVTFVDCEAWGKTGELVAKYLTKGRAALVEGRLKLDSWEDKNTKEKRSKMKVVVEQVQFLGGREGGEQDEAPARSAPSARSTAANPAPLSKADEDVPF